MRRRRNAHRLFVSINAGNFFVHAKQVAVLFPDLIFSLIFNRFREVEIYRIFQCSYTIPRVDPFFGSPGSDITGR